MPIINGKAYWAKIDRPVQKYKTTAPTEMEWTIDVTIDKKSKELINSLHPSATIKNRDDERGDFFTFKKNAFNRNGEPLPMKGKNKFYLDAVQVVDLVPYERSDDFDEVDGYVAESTMSNGASSEEKAPF